jgi:hypothetical protein
MTPLVAFTTALLALAVAILWPRVMQSLAGCLVVLVTFVVSCLVTALSVAHAFWGGR